MVLKPIHDMLFAFLRSLPNDGTFNQHASEKRAREKSLRAGRSYGYDLSAATDRLPIGIQSILLNLLIPDLGDNWALLLTRRDYYMYIPKELYNSLGIPTNKTALQLNSQGGKAPNALLFGGQEVPVSYNSKGAAYLTLRYSVGQPMGALSSWAMLAVTHHLLVQLAYRNAYGVDKTLPFTRDTWYTGYEVLGDDIIIFDSLVAAEYLRIMDALGVPINTTKSVVATVPVTEYAKVTSYYGLNVSALSWKMFLSGNSFAGRMNIIYSLLSRGIITRNIIPWIERTAGLSLGNIGSPTPTLMGLWTMLSNDGRISIDDALKGLINGKIKVFNLARAILLNADVNKIKLALPGIFTGTGLHLYERKAVASIYKVERPWFQIRLWKPVARFLYGRAQMPDQISTLTREMLEVLLSKTSYEISKEEIMSLGLELDPGEVTVAGPWA
jgi:hypothetical protein